MSPSMSRGLSLAILLAGSSEFAGPLHAQQYLNVRLVDGSARNIPIQILRQIAFDESARNMNLTFFDATTQYLPIASIGCITSSEIAEGTLLPVEFGAFSAIVQGNEVVLSWETFTETKNYGFGVERRTESSRWEDICFIRGQGTSNSPTRYRYIDTPRKQGRLHYRLRQTDNDGTLSYVGELSIVISASVNPPLSQNYPNPFNPHTTIQYSVAQKAHVSIRIFDLLGREVGVVVDEIKDAGSYEVVFEGTGLSSGFYFCKLTTAGSTDVRKMTMMS